MAISDWPAATRPREKLLASGAKCLSDAELLAIFLRTGVAGKSAVTLAQELLCRFGGLSQLLAASQAEFCTGLGLGAAKYAQLQAVLEMAARYCSEHLEQPAPCRDVADAKQLAKLRLGSLRYEVFAVFFLDNQHRLIRFEELFRGTFDGAQVYPRELAQRCLQLNAAAVLLAHNHPSGARQPSASDHRLTARIAEVLALLEVRLLDHILVAQGAPISFAEEGWL